MIRLEIPGGFYCDALPLPGGEYACIYAEDNSVVTTHLGSIPTQEGRKPGFVAVTNMPQFKFAGQSNVGAMTVEWIDGAGWQPPQREACGTNAVIYDANGVLQISDCSIGVNGWRYVEPNTGRLVTGDQTISSRQASPPFDGLAEWTYLGLGLYIGQCNVIPGVGLWDGLNLRMVSPGRPRSIRAHRKGDNASVAYVQENNAPSVLIWLTVAELCASPVVSVEAQQPTFAFSHPILVAPFKDPDGRTDAPLEVVVDKTNQTANRPYFIDEKSLDGLTVGPCWGIYTESADITTARTLAVLNEARVIYCHDAPTLPVIPAGLRPHDQVWIEYYRLATESLEQSVARWRVNTQAMLNGWPGDCGVVPMFYCQGGIGDDELWPVSAVLEGLMALSELVNLSPRIKIVAPFAYQRANGITAHPELQEAFARLLDAAYLAGRATLLPVSTTPIPIPVPPLAQGGAILMAVQEVIHYAGTKASGEANRKRLVNPNDKSQVFSVERDGTVNSVQGAADGRFEQFKVAGNIVSVNSANPGEPENWHSFVGVDVS